jgi:nucleotide-binding universal stress UspA family protein
VLRVASEFDADLIVVGSHRDRPGFWNRFGSTAERILGDSRTPVLVVHGAPRSVPRRLLAAVDDSETGTRVIAQAEALVHRFGAAGSVLHALPRQPIHWVLPPAELIVHDQYLIDENEYIRKTHEWLSERITDGLRPTVLVGDAAEAILAEATRTGADFLVVGRERKSKTRRFLLGGVTSVILRAANAPVLVIPSPDGPEEAVVSAGAELDSQLQINGVVHNRTTLIHER